MKFDKELVQILCPYGEWPHPRGLQLVDEESARRMKRAAAFPMFGKIPIYIGHPDDSPSGQKPVPVGRIKRICTTQNGIAVVSQYSDDAYAKVVGGKFAAMSPRWQMERLDDGKFRPVKLISAGLTNNPNIPASGKILDFNDSRKNLTDAKNATVAAVQKIEKCRKIVEKCRAENTALGEEIRSAAVSERVAKRKLNSESLTPQPASRELAELAKERSRRLGEPYLKSFASVKRGIL